MIIALALACTTGENPGDTDGLCEAPPPPAEATLPMGPSGDVLVLPGGRFTKPVGVTVELGGFPGGALVNPTVPVAYVANTGNFFRALQVVSTADGSVQQTLDRTGGFVGFALSSDGSRLYAAGGPDHQVEVWDVGADGLLTAADPIPVAGYAAGMALVGDTLWVAEFIDGDVVPVNVADGTLGTPVVVGPNPFAVLAVGGDVYVSLFGGAEVVVVDSATGAVAARVPAASDPEGMAVSPDGKRVFVAISDGDRVDAIDTATRSVVASATLGGDVADESGAALPGTNVVDVAAVGDLLYVARAADNAVTVLGADALDDRGSFPVGWYPTSLAPTPDGRLVVTNGKGVGVGPFVVDEGISGADEMSGTVTVVDPATLDLAATSATVAWQNRRPRDVYPFACEGTFPIPRKAGDPTPLQHVVLLVRENKTYDALLGDLDVADADGDPSLAMYGEDVTPNLHSLARTFTSHDNFYDDSEVSGQGHMWLTAGIIDDYLERGWIESGRAGASFATAPGLAPGTWDWGSLFTNLMANDVDFRNFGETASIDGEVDGDTVGAHTDLGYPGVVFNLAVADEDRANYLVQKLITEGDFPPFVFAILPRDHTYGTASGEPTPESMVADNDLATGIFIDALSHSSWWDSTVVFVVEDDPQDGFDHVDYHRSILLAASPWVKRGHQSHVHADYESLLATIELILGVPPMNRWTAQASPLWDAFTSTPDDTPFVHDERRIPDGTNARGAPGQDESDDMDWGEPDENPGLQRVLWMAHRSRL